MAKSRKIVAPDGRQSLPLNEKSRKPVRNTFPKTVKIDPYAMGAIGVRIMTERALGALHGYGNEVWDLLGIKKLDLARRRPEIVAALRSIVADPERSNFVNRSGAVALLGELGGQSALPDLSEVLDSPFERRSTRGWAAVGIGRCAGAKGVESLARYATDTDPFIRRKVIDGFVASKAQEAIPLLEDILARDTDRFVANRAFSALRKLEQVLKLEPRSVRPRDVPKGGGKTVARP